MKKTKLAVVTDRDWTPRAYGEGMFCSPACGFDCTQHAYDRAVADSATLAKRMGEGWTPHVWENCGWHYTVDKGVVAIHPIISGGAISGVYKVTGYHVYFNSKVRQVVTEAQEPEDALGFAVQEARQLETTLRNELAAILDDGED